MEDGKPKRDVSEFNSAVSYLNRLNVLFSMCIEAAINLDPYMWFHTLQALYRELSTEMKQPELTYFETNGTIINKEISEWMATVKRHGPQPLPNNLYKNLHDYELKLRYIMKAAGLQQKVMEDAMKALK